MNACFLGLIPFAARLLGSQSPGLLWAGVCWWDSISELEVGLASVAWGRCCGVLGRSVMLTGLGFPQLLCATMCVAAPCVSGIVVFQTSSHQPVLGRPGSLTAFACYNPETAPFLLLVPASEVPPGVCDALSLPAGFPTPLPGLPAHGTLTARLLFSLGFSSLHSTPNGPALLSWDHIIHYIVGFSIQLICTSCSWKDSVRNVMVVYRKGSFAQASVESQMPFWQSWYKTLVKIAAFLFSGKVAIGGLWFIISHEQGAANGPESPRALLKGQPG